MKDSVRSYFIEFSKQFEGRVPCMYLDTHNPPLVTIGVGNLIDPLTEARNLPMRRLSDGGLASPKEIDTEWNRVKRDVSHAHDHTSYWRTTAQLTLPDDDIDSLVMSRLDRNNAYLQSRPAFHEFAAWPADAQLGLHSMAWAMGPAFRFPLFLDACYRGDFGSAAAQCHMDAEHNAGLVPRNRANLILFSNASRILRSTVFNPDVLVYPLSL